MKVAVLGLGVDTGDVVPYLKKRGDQVTILDEARGFIVIGPSLRPPKLRYLQK